MKLTIFAVFLFGAIAAVPMGAQEDATPPWLRARSYGYSFMPQQCLVVSAEGKKFRYRDAWVYGPTRAKYKESELQKIAGHGVNVFRLNKDASDDEVSGVIKKCQAGGQRAPDQLREYRPRAMLKRI